ncbi:MAG: metal ABC transporter permease [Candidatus Gracilibacteria bacterium]|nr:metal ABC transporter permease [Candidatus Gracilibacteria bacterium]
MLEILNYSFFQNALIGGILIGIISSILGVFIVMRKEANITHSISNFLFLGIAVSLFLNGNYYLFAIIFGIIASLLIFFIEKTKFITKESTKEIISQTGIAGGIFLIGFIENLQLDINSFLFGNILLINNTDLILIFILFILTIIFFIIFGKNFLAITINEDIAKAKGIKVDLYNLFFLIFLSLFIGVSIKIFGIFLIGAFLIIGANTSKILAKSLKQVFIFSIIISLFSVIFGLFASYFLGTSSGATIVLLLVLIFITSLFYKKIIK